MNQIVKYETKYVVHFKKELEIEPFIISKESFEIINEKLATESFVTINWHTHSKFNISHISPYEIEKDISMLINSIDDIEIKKQVQEEIKKNILAKKEVTREKALSIIEWVKFQIKK